MVGKKRPIAHIKGESGVQVLKKQLPSEWVPREYVPDYGIDLSIELFSPAEGGFVTKGEHVFFQVKATDSIEKVPYKIYPRMNIEKEYRDVSGDPIEIEVIKFVLDTDLLFTVETMGSSVPVLLTVVDLSTENIYFVCLNDYIEKVLIPEDADYTNKDHKTIYIPAANLLNSEFGTKVVEWYGKRGKLYALFNKIHYQAHELQYCPDYEITERVDHFLKILMKFDAWSAGEYWGILDAFRASRRKQKTEMDIDDPMVAYIHSIQTHDTYTLYSRTFYVKNQPVTVRDKYLGEALQYIIPQKRAVILLSYFEGYNDTEVANILGISPTSIARRKKSVLLRLRELLEVRANDE